MREEGMETDVVVAGAGLAGLTAATYLARGGLRVTVLDGAGGPGGRAHSARLSGFNFNLGPHAADPTLEGAAR